MSFLSNLIKDVAPFVAAAAPGTPIGSVAAVKAVADVKAQQKFLSETARQKQEEQQRRLKQMAMGSGEFQSPGITFTQPRVQQPGFFDQLGTLASNVGSTLIQGAQQFIPSLINQKVFGVRPQSAAQGPALTTITNVGAQESQGSGSIQAGTGALLTPILQGARNLLKTPQGQLALGGGTALVGSMFGGKDTSVRVTRKMKRDARMVLNMTGGNLQAAADMFGVSQEFFVFVLLKRFRNDGPVVTKAALRKTKQTIRRLHSMQDVLKSITPTATMRRKAPMKRASTTTLIKN